MRSAINRRRNQCLSKSDDRFCSVGFLNQDFAKIDMSNKVFHAYSMSKRSGGDMPKVKLVGRFNSNRLDSCVCCTCHFFRAKRSLSCFHLSCIYLVVYTV